jgi:hypothetical protein
LPGRDAQRGGGAQRFLVAAQSFHPPEADFFQSSLKPFKFHATFLCRLAEHLQLLDGHAKAAAGVHQIIGAFHSFSEGLFDAVNAKRADDHVLETAGGAGAKTIQPGLKATAVQSDFTDEF